MNQSTIDLITANNTTSNQEQTERDATLAKFEIAILSLIFILIVLGNGSVIIALVGARIKIQRMYYFLLHLSIADLLTAFFNVLPQLIWEITVQFHGNNWLCKFVKYIQLLGPYLSSYVLVVTAIDRYQAICFPLLLWTERRAKIMISVAWIISLICCLPQIFIFSYVQIAITNFPNKTSSFRVLDVSVDESKSYTNYIFQCWGSFIQPYGEKIYVLWYAISVFFIPLIVLIYTYFNICKVIWINARVDRSNPNKTKKSKSKTVIFHSKFTASNLLNSKNDNQLQSNQLSNERTCVRTQVRTNSQICTHNSHNKNTSKKATTSQLESTKDCCRAKNGQKNSLNNEINNQTTVLATSTANQMKSASSSILKSRTLAQTSKLSKAKIKTIKITIVVIICYISCSLPFCAVQLWAHFYPNAQTSTLWTGYFITITMLLPSLNSCVNPFIYLLLNRNLLYTLLKLLFGTKCVDSAVATDCRNETTNQRLSISMNKTALITTDYQTNTAANQSTNNSPIQSPALNSPASIDTIMRKNRLKRISSNQSDKSACKSTSKIDQTKDKLSKRSSDTNLNSKISSNANKINLKSVNLDQTKKVQTVASLNPLNKINVECLVNRVNNADMQINKFNLPRVRSELNSLTLTATKSEQEFIYQISSSAPDLKSAE